MIHQEGSNVIIENDYMDTLTDLSVIAGAIQKKFGKEIYEHEFITHVIDSVLVGLIDTRHRGLLIKPGKMKKVAEITNWFVDGLIKDVIEEEEVNE